ncbi:carbonic anhydrase [Streptomyces boninensis]|uniref:carbonic anhydrase n=1 Tax=Streptomyces boninensis TaxID=2039455 RepID=UPI003B20BEB9
MTQGAEGLLRRRELRGVEFVPLDERAKRPLSGVAIVACMDARLGIETIFGLQPGDAHVIRNAGGCVTPDALRSLKLSQERGGTSEILLVHHEDCAALSDPAGDLAQCIDRLRTSTELPHNGVVRGFLYTRSGALREIRPRRAEKLP